MKNLRNSWMTIAAYHHVQSMVCAKNVLGENRMAEELQDLIESANVLAEILKLHYDSFVNAGFSKGQAMDLTLAVMDNMYEDMEDE